MTMRLNPYLTFTDTARAAMEFYRDVLGGELRMNTFGEFGAPEGVPADGIMHAQLETPAGFVLMASDSPHGPVTPGDGVTLSISGDEPAIMRDFFAKLSEGGQVTMPLEKQMWGDEFGMLTDKFGQHWMVNIAGDAAEQA